MIKTESAVSLGSILRGLRRGVSPTTAELARRPGHLRAVPGLLRGEAAARAGVGPMAATYLETQSANVMRAARYLDLLDPTRAPWSVAATASSWVVAPGGEVLAG